MSTLLVRSQRQFPPTPPSLNVESFQQPSQPKMQLPQTPQSPSQPNGKPSPNESSQSSNLQTSNTLPTPAHSVNGSAASFSSNMSTSPDSNKRKRSAEDLGNDGTRKKIHVEDRELGIEDLHLDVGEKYLLCKTPHSQHQPDLSTNLFDIYSLNGIASAVARTLPTGEKNSLRKTYKGKIKELNISGKFDVTVHGEQDGGMFAMMCVPETEWHLQHVRASPICNGLDASVLSALSKAMHMTKGLIPKKEWDSTVLGDLEEKKDPKKLDKKLALSGTKSPAPSPIASTARGPTSGGNGRIVSENRPKRKIKQRSYGDTSFEGYGEGYVDDEMVDGGYSTGDGDDRGGQKRRKKNASTPNSGAPSRHNSYGPGMVGA